MYLSQFIFIYFINIYSYCELSDNRADLLQHHVIVVTAILTQPTVNKPQ